MKFCDLYNFNCASLMFKISMGIHPPSITNMFIKCDNFDRNLNYSLDMLPYTYLKKTGASFFNRNMELYKYWPQKLPKGKACSYIQIN